MSAVTTTPADQLHTHPASLADLMALANPGDPRFDREWAARMANEALQQTTTRPQPAVDPAERAAERAAERPAEFGPRQQGRFTPGNPGGPGRPRKIRVVEQDVLTIIANSISDQDWADMTQTAVAQAIEGDSAARRWIFQMLFRHAKTTMSDTAAAQASGLSDEQRRFLLARDRYGEAMQAAFLAQQEMESLAPHAVTPKMSPANAAEFPQPVAPAALPESTPVPAARAPNSPAAIDRPLEVRLAPSAPRPERSDRETPRAAQTEPLNVHPQLDSVLAPNLVAAILAAHRAGPHLGAAPDDAQKRQETVENGAQPAGWPSRT